MTREEMKQVWSDGRNWWGGFIYHCANDPRLIVPQRHRIGWTWNFSHHKVWPVLLVSAAVGAGPALWYKQTYGCPPMKLVLAYIGIVIVIGIIVGALYSRRFEKQP